MDRAVSWIEDVLRLEGDFVCASSFARPLLEKVVTFRCGTPRSEAHTRRGIAAVLMELRPRQDAAAVPWVDNR